MSAQTSVSADASGVGAASDEVLAGTSDADGDGVIGAALVEMVEVAALDWLSGAATVVVNVTTAPTEDPDPPDAQPATANAPAASTAVTLRMVAARQPLDNIHELLNRIVNYLSRGL